MDSNLKVGDWVRSYSKGIWRIYRVIEVEEVDPSNGKLRKRTIIFSSRFVNDSFKRSFSNEGCNPFFVYKLDGEELDQLDAFIQSNPDLFAKFEKFKPKPIDLVYTARISKNDGYTKTDVEKQFDNLNKIKSCDLIKTIESKGFEVGVHPSWLVQFLSEDHETQDGQLVYSYKRVLDQ